MMSEESKRRRPRLAVIQSVRFEPDEIDMIRCAADSHGVTVSAFIRSAACGQAIKPWIKWHATATSPTNSPSPRSRSRHEARGGNPDG